MDGARRSSAQPARTAAAAATAALSQDVAEDSGLEYHIKFPTARYASSQASSASEGSGGSRSSAASVGSEYVLVCDEERLPVVLLFGWAGCRDKHLAKYSRIYEERGFITLRYILPIKYILWRRQHAASIGEKLVKLLYDLNFDGHPIIVHCFSNSGAFLYEDFSAALAGSPQPIQVRGVVFDSGPGARRLANLYKAISAIFGGNRLYNAAMSLLFTLLCSLLWLWELAQKRVGGGRHDLVPDPFNRLRAEPHAWPQHFIYSEADTLISHKDVELFMRHRESVGVKVSALRYKASAHVKHFSAHKESYEASVLAFVNECLSYDSGRSVGEHRRDENFPSGATAMQHKLMQHSA